MALLEEQASAHGAVKSLHIYTRVSHKGLWGYTSFLDDPRLVQGERFPRPSISRLAPMDGALARELIEAWRPSTRCDTIDVDLTRIPHAVRSTVVEKDEDGCNACGTETVRAGSGPEPVCLGC